MCPCYHLAISFPFPSSNDQLLWRRLRELSKIGALQLLRDDEDRDSGRALEEEAGVEARKHPKKENTFRNARPIPPLSLDRFPLWGHEILLDAPPALNPPSISVYTTGSSRSPARRPPENLPTANPPPGSRHIVSPAASSSLPPVGGRAASPSDSDPPLQPKSVGISWRHTGHELLSESHGRMQSLW